jgi:hypothetical protein
MYFKTAAIKRFMLIRLLRNVELEDVAALQKIVERAHEEQGEPLHCVMLIGEKIAPPSLEFRRHIVVSLDAISPISESFHVVLEGSGFTSALKRMVAAGIIAISKMGRKTSIYSNAEEVLREVSLKKGYPLQAILDDAKKQGLL